MAGAEHPSAPRGITLRRIRPCDESGIKPENDFSFPSGHTIASFEGAVSIFIYNKKWGIPALILAFLIAFSRLYLCFHYPTDVLVAAILGIAFAILASYIAKWMINKFKIPCTELK